MELKLPPSVTGYDDLKRLVRTLEGRDALFINAGTGTTPAPPVSEKLLSDLAALNNLDLMDRAACQQLKNLIGTQMDKLPQLQISFAVEPSGEVVESILVWLRKNIHPSVLLKIGLQPSIAAGCILRSPNKVFDMSLRSYIKQQDGYLVELIKGAASGKR